MYLSMEMQSSSSGKGFPVANDSQQASNCHNLEEKRVAWEPPMLCL
jgi:hypothetical protein